MRYFKIDRLSGVKTELSYEEAKSIISKYYVEKVSTFDEMLSIASTIPCGYSNLEIEE